MDDTKPDGSAPGPFEDILAANRIHRATFALGHLTAVPVKRLALVTCVDTRIDPLSALGLRPGDAKILRNVGARVTDDVLRSLSLLTALLGVERVAVIAHTDCALAKADDDALRASIAEASGADASGLAPLAVSDQATTLRADVERVREFPLIPGSVIVAGFVYDVRTGELRPTP